MTAYSTLLHRSQEEEEEEEGCPHWGVVTTDWEKDEKESYGRGTGGPAEWGAPRGVLKKGVQLQEPDHLGPIGGNQEVYFFLLESL